MKMSSTAAAQIADEDIMKMRLLFDGDGQGDERRMNMLLKSVIKFTLAASSSQNSSGSAAADLNIIETHYQRILAQLASIQFSLEKTRQIQTMNQEEASNYTQLEQAIIEGIEETRGIIEATKLELEDAKIIRKNKLEYDEIGKKINELASREASEARIKEIEAEKETLRQKERQIEMKLAQRREQFSIIIKSIHQLQELIFDEDGVGYLSDEAADEDLNEPEIVPLDISQE